jgi:spore maturation protein CgeB
VSDVHDGLVAALRRQGHLVSTYDLSKRIAQAGHWLHAVWRRSRRTMPELEKPGAVTVIEKACEDIVPRALTLNVDAVLIISAMYLHPDALVLLRRARIPTGLIFTESPYDDARQARIAHLADVCWTQERTSVATLRPFNPRVHYLPAAYDTTRHTPEEQPGDAFVHGHDVVFVGTLFHERIALLSAVDWTGIDLGIYGHTSLLSSRSKLRQHLRGGATDNAMAAALYRRAKVGLNLFRSTAEWTSGQHVTTGESLNPRAYELAACGTFQVSDIRPEVTDLFGGAVWTFADAAGLQSLLHTALADDDTRRELARAAWASVLPHTFDARARQVVEQLAPAIVRQSPALAGVMAD